MFRIGDFSRIARVSARLLRYYDEIGLLKPSIVDAASGYRFYSAEQLSRLNRILVLKQLGLTLEQIAKVMEDSISAQQLRGMLLIRRAELEQALEEEAERLRQVETRIAQIDVEGQLTADDVMIRSEPATSFLSVRQTVPSFLAAREILGQLARTVPGRVPAARLGHLAGIAHSPEFEPDALDVELGYFFDGDVDDGGGGITLPDGSALSVRNLPAVERMAVCVRIGLPEHAHLVTAKIARFVEANGYVLSGPSREVFLQPPRPDRMHESVVEMQFPIARAWSANFQ
jgi:DNA-binding transcriptional MerR regulator/effector-binding domain-containing protein